MRRLTSQAFLLAALFLAACSSSRPLPKYEKPIARTAVQNVRTTAYTHTESDHVQYANRNALGGTLSNGPVKSAAADWSRWPAGSIFRIVETGEIYEVDDYGWALAGTNTIDLYKPSRRAMNAWGVRRVTIENLRWGDPARSLQILRGRSRYAHVRRMIGGIESHFAQIQEAPTASIAQATPVEPAVPVVRATAVAPAATAPNSGVRQAFFSGEAR